jgi:ribosome-binding ATPase YchF (GTP1/OBG family)
VFEKVRDAMSRGTGACALKLDGEEHSAIAEMHLITAKPMLYVANVAESDLAAGAASPHLAALRGHAAKQGAACVPICAKIEAELNELSEEERQEFLSSLGLKESGLSALSRAIYKLLGLISFFTFNEKELRAWNLRDGSTAPQAAGTIHTDFEKGFVKADVYTVEELERYTSEHALRAAGRIRSEGREYVVRDGEILFFKFTQ